MAYGRPWYIQATDVAHRVFVIGIIGFSGAYPSPLPPAFGLNSDIHLF